MKQLKISLTVLAVILVFGCKKQKEQPETIPAPQPPKVEAMYFPSIGTSEWQTKSMSELGWNVEAVQPLKDYLVDKHTKAFMILVNGRIVVEEYMNGQTSSDTWTWNSAGKTLVASMIGIAQQENFLNINNRVSGYIGTGWTSEPLAKENLITVKHLLTMTSGLNDSNQLVIKTNLTYMADAGTRWSYHNVFQKLMDVVSASTGQDFQTYFNARLRDKIGMEGSWNFGPVYKLYQSNARSMARFGILALNRGKWNGEQILNETYFNECISSSQNINPSYGYLWWLNGKANFMVPGGQTVYPGYLVPNAPADFYAAMGASDQRIYVVPSKNMVVVRMGDASDPNNPSFAVSGFDNDLWGKINTLIK